MKRGLYILAMLSLCSAGCTKVDTPPQLTVQPLPAIAPASDYGKGVSAAAAGEIGGTLLIAGGANFPDTPAAEGGSKRFYDEIYALAEGASEWELAGSLPHPAAYGAAFVLDDCIIMAGGANAGGTLQDVFRLSVNSCAFNSETDSQDGTLATVTPLSSLPVPVEQAGFAQNGKKLYIAGGLTNGVSSLGVYSCDMGADGEWRMMTELPEAMVQPIAAVTERFLYVWGGFDPAKKEAANYGFRFDMQERVWNRTKGLPDGGTAVGAAAVQDSDGTMWVAGGVNREIFNAALNQPAEKSAEYLSQPVEYYRFRQQIFRFDTVSERWSAVGETPAAARAGAAVVLSPTYGFTILNGEQKPGIRSAEINSIRQR